MAGGAVILLEGDDYTGRCVNLAARLATAAQASEVLSTPELAALRAVRHAGGAGGDDHGRRDCTIRWRSCGWAWRRERARNDAVARNYGDTMPVSETTYETIEFERGDGIGWLRMNRPGQAQLVHDRDVARDARARPRDPRRRRPARGGRDRPRARVLVGHRHVGVHRRIRRRRSKTAPTRARVTPIPPSTASCARRRRTRGSPRRATRRSPPCTATRSARACSSRSRATSACSRAARKVGLLEHKYGILPDLGGTQRLPRVVGASKAKELIWTAAQIDAEESYRIGLCDRLVDDEELETEVTALAATIAAQPPLAVQGAKRAVDASRAPAGRRRPRVRGRAAARLPALRRHARGDHRVRRAARAPEYKGTSDARRDALPRTAERPARRAGGSRRARRRTRA